MTATHWRPGVDGWMVGRRANRHSTGEPVWWCGPNEDVGYSVCRLRRGCPARVWPDIASVWDALQEVFDPPQAAWEHGFRVVRTVNGVPGPLPVGTRLCTRPRCANVERYRGLCDKHWRADRAAKKAAA